MFQIERKPFNPLKIKEGTNTLPYLDKIWDRVYASDRRAVQIQARDLQPRWSPERRIDDIS